MFKTILPLLLAASLLFAPATWGQVFCPDVYKKTKRTDLPKDTEVAVYKFYTAETNNKSSVAAYDLHYGLFKPKQVGTLQVNESFSKNSNSVLLARLQDYSTHVMETSGYISKEVKERQPELLDSTINPAQVTFLEMTRPLEAEVVKKNPEKYPQEVRSDRPDETRPDYVHIREAGLWYISGQYLWPYSREGLAKNRDMFSEFMEVSWRPKHKQADPKNYDQFDPYRIDIAMQPMPWQLSKAVMDSTRLPIRIKERSIVLDRQKFPIVFELGRVAQSEPGRFRELLKMAVDLMSYEVHFTMQAQMKDAFVFVNTMSAARAEAFQKMGFEKLPEACTVPSACILFIRLDKLFQKHASQTNSYRYARVLGMFPGSSLHDIQNLISRVHTYFRSDLDLVLPVFGLVHRTPVVMHDFSVNYKNMLVLLGLHMGKSYEQSVEIYKELNQWRQDYRTGGRGYENESPASEFSAFLEANNFIRLTNLSESFTAIRDNVELLLMTTEKYLFHRYKELAGEKGREAHFEQVEFDFFIHTPSIEVAKNLRKHGYQEAPVMYDSNGKPHYGFVIPRLWVKDMLGANPHLRDILTRQGLDQGYWFFRALNAMPMQF